MRRNVFLLAFFVAIFGFSLITPVANENSNSTLMQYVETDPRIVSGIGDNLEDFIDTISDLHAPTDIGTHSVFSELQEYDANYDQMTESNTGSVGYNLEDYVDQLSTLHLATPDIGTHSAFAEMQDYDAVYDTLTEANTGSVGVNEYKYVDGLSGTAIWTTVGATPYLSAQDQPTNYIYTASNGLVSQWYTFAATSGLSGTFTVNLSIYWAASSGDSYPQWELDWTNDGAADSSGSFTTKTIWGWTSTGSISGLDTVTEINDCRIRFTLNKGGGGPEQVNIDAARLGINQAGSTNYDLDLEVGWISAQYSETNEYLCIYGGTQGDEALSVDVWNGAGWTNVILDLQQDQWNNVSISSYLIGSAFEIRFTDTSDESLAQDSWQIEGVLLHVWTVGSTNYELDLEVGWTTADYDEVNEYLCIYPVTGGGWPSEDIKVDIWSGTWTNVISDLTPDQWNNVSISSYLTGSAVEIRFLGGSETGDTTQNTWEIDAVLLHTWTVSYAPANDQEPTLDNPTDTDNMYAQYQEYQVTVYVSDQNGYADIAYLEIDLYDNTQTTRYCTFRYDEDTNTFTKEYDAGTYISLNTGSSTAIRSGNDINATFFFTIDWDFPDSTDLAARCYVVDTQTESSTTWYSVDWDVETRLDFSVSPSIDDGSGTPDRGDLDGSFSITGTVIYYGSSDVYPPSNAVDVWVSASEYGTVVGPWEDLTLTSGAFDITCYADDQVDGSSDTYTVIIVAEGLGSGSSDLYYTNSATDSYIADRLVISMTDPIDQRINIRANATGIIVSAIYDYDDSVFDGTLTLNDTTFDYGTIGRRGYTVSLAAGGTHGVSVIGVNDATYCIWDSLTATIANPPDQRINIGTNASGVIVSAIYDYDGSAFDGTLTLNNTQFQYGSAQIQYYTVQSVSGGTYGITEISLNDVTWCIWDSLTITITDPADQRQNVNVNASGILISAVYDYDGSPFDGTFTLNNTQFSYGTAQRQDYTVESVSGDTHGITAISTNDVTYFIWDSLTVTITDPADQRINIDTAASGIVASAVYDYDGAAFDGTLTLNNTEFTYSTAQIQWYTVQSASGGIYGISTINTNDDTWCIWDSLTITITGPADSRININSAASGIVASAVYDYDGAAFDGTFTLNNTQFTYSTAQIQWYTVDSVTGDSYGITAIGTNDVTWCIWDSLTITITDPIDQRQNVNVNASGIIVTGLYDYDGSTFDGTLTLNNTQFLYSTAQRQGYTVGTVSGGTHGITIISTNDVTYFIWDSLTVSIAGPSDSRINIDTAATGIVATAVYDYDGSAFDGTLTLNNSQFTYSTAQIQWYTVESASGGAHGISVILVNDMTWCIWDSLTILITDPSDQRQNVNVNATGILVSAVYDYDGSPFDGTLTLNNTQFSYLTAQRQDYTVQSVIGGAYGITAISINDVTYFIWDSLTVTINGPVDQRININTNASGIIVTAIYDYDGVAFEGTLTLNNTQFLYGTAQRRDYTVDSASGGVHGITVIATNDDTYCIWDSLTITISGPSDQRININANASGIIVSAVYDYDGVAFDGTLTLNNTQFSYPTAQRQDYTVQSASGGVHGISVINSNDATYCIWDSLTIAIIDPADQRININTNATGILISAVYDYDGSAFDGTFTLNNTQFLYDTVQRQGYTVASVSGDTHEITAISTNDVTYCIWDRLLITIGVDDSTPFNGIQANFTLTVLFDYDNFACTTYQIVIQRNSTWWHSFTDSNTSLFVDANSDATYTYSVYLVTSESTYNIIAFTSNSQQISWSIIPNNAPTNDADPVLTNPDSGFMFARYNYYIITSNVSDADGYIDIDYVELTLYDNTATTPLWTVRYTVSGGIFSIRLGAEYIALGASSYASMSGNDLDIIWYIKIDWDHVDMLNTVPRQFVTDGVASDSDDSITTWDIETRLDYSFAPSLSDNRGDVDTSDLIATGSVVYYGSTHSPLANETDVWVVHDISGTWSGDLITGSFSISSIGSSASVRLNTYTIKVVVQGSGSGGIDLYYSTSVTDTFITDRIEVYQAGTVDSRIDIDVDCEVWWRARFEYDSTEIQIGLNLELNGSRTLVWDADNLYWRWQETSGSPASAGFNVVSGSETTYGLTTLSVITSVQQVIWDAVVITITDPSDQRINVGENATGIIVSAVYAFDGAQFDGSFTLNNTNFVYPTPQRQDYTVLSVSGDTYGITTISSNDVTYCIWDSLTITITDPADQRQNVNVNATGIVVSAVYDYDGLAFDGTLTLNNTQFNYTTAQRQAYAVQSVSGGIHGITEISTNDVTYFIWDSLTVTITGPVDQRININTAASGIAATAVYDYDGSVFDGTITLNNTQFTYSTAQIQWYIAESASGDTHGITTISSNDLTWCIWDSLTVSITDPGDQRININTAASGIAATAVYDYDGSVFDGTLTLNNSQFTYSTGQIQWYTVESASGDSHGITEINVNDLTWCIWDQLDIVIGVDDASLENGIQANFTITVKYLFDDAICTTYQIVIERNTTWWHSFTDSNLSLFIDTNTDVAYWYNASLVSSESTYGITAFTADNRLVTWSLAPNEIPMNDASPNLTNADDTDFLYARYRYYVIITSVSDLDGYADIEYVELTLYDDSRSTPIWTIRYTVATDSFTVELGIEYITLGSSSFASKSGTDLDVTWYIKIDWDHSYLTNIDTRQYVYDGLSADEDFYESNWNVETRLDYSTLPSLSDNRGDVNTADLVGSGAVTYFNSGLSPHANETDVWIINDVSDTWSGDLTAGSFSISGIGSSASVGLNNYTFKIVAEGAGAGGTDLYVSTSPIDTFITDRIEIYEAGVADSRININSTCEVWWRARYEYDGVEIQSGLLIQLNGSRTLVWNAGGSYWMRQENSATPTSAGFYILSAVESEYGLAGWTNSTSVQQVIWDALIIVMTDPVDARVNVGANATGIFVSATYAFDGAVFDGILTLNNTNFMFASPQAQGYTVLSAAGDTYGITTILSNDVTYCIWDRVLIISVLADELYHDPGDNVRVSVEMQYEYDGSSVLAGIFNIAGYPLTHVGSGVWETFVTLGSYNSVAFDDLTLCSATLHGITEYNMDLNEVTVYWDRIEIYSVSTDDSRVSVGDSAEVQWGARLENAGIVIPNGVIIRMTGDISCIPSGGVYEASVTLSTVGSAVYSIISASLGEIESFIQSAGDATIIWDRVKVTSITATSLSQDAGVATEIHATLMYEFDDTPFTNGAVFLSGESVSMTYNSAGGYWTATITKNIAGNYIFSIERITDALYGLSALDPDDLSVEIEWVALPGFTPDAMTLMLIGGGAGIALIGAALIASRRRRGGVSVEVGDIEVSDFGIADSTIISTSAEPEVIETEAEPISDELRPEEIEPSEADLHVESIQDKTLIEEGTAFGPPELEVEAAAPAVISELEAHEPVDTLPETELEPIEEPDLSESVEDEVLPIEEGQIVEIEVETVLDSEFADIESELAVEPEIKPEAEIKLEKSMTKKELLDRLPPEIRDALPEEDVKRMSKKEVRSLLESYTPPESPLPEVVPDSIPAGVSESALGLEDLSKLDKKVLLELLPDDIKSTASPRELRRLSKKEIISLLESFLESEK